MPVYAKVLKLHRGVDNQIQFQFLNQQQKPVDVTGKVITFRLIDSTGLEILLEKLLTPQLSATGIMLLTLNSTELDSIVPQRCGYSLEIPSGTFEFPVYVDPASGARGQIDVEDSVFPRFVNSQIVTIPTGQIFPNNAANSNNAAQTVCTTLANTSYAYMTSVIYTKTNPGITLQATYANFTGNVSIQGSTLPDRDWYLIGNVTSHANLTDTVGYVVEGYHPYVRMMFESSAGAVANILAR